MNPTKKSTLRVKGTAVAVLSRKADDFISLTDIAKHKEPDRADQIIQNWMRNRNTVEFLGVWENLNNPDFKPLEFEGFRNRAGLNSFVLTERQASEETPGSENQARASRSACAAPIMPTLMPFSFKSSVAWFVITKRFPSEMSGTKQSRQRKMA